MRPEGAGPGGEWPEGVLPNGAPPEDGMPDGLQMPQGGGMALTSAREGSNLKYIDDNISSYTVLRESAVTDRTNDSDFVKIIEMHEKLGYRCCIRKPSGCK